MTKQRQSDKDEAFAADLPDGPEKWIKEMSALCLAAIFVYSKDLTPHRKQKIERTQELEKKLLAHIRTPLPELTDTTNAAPQDRGTAEQPSQVASPVGAAPTPRTDGNARRFHDGETHWGASVELVDAKVARQLERELASKTRDADHFFQLSGRYLEELNAARSAIGQRAVEDVAVLDRIGNLLDHWDQVPNDIKSDPGIEVVGRILSEIDGIWDGRVAPVSPKPFITDKTSSEYVPLCDAHAASWFTERNHLKGGMDAECVVCAHETPASITHHRQPVTQDGPISGTWTTVGQTATELDFMLTQFQAEVEAMADSEANGLEEAVHHTEQAHKLKRKIIEKYTPQSAIGNTSTKEKT